MAATPLDPTVRYLGLENNTYTWVPAIADKTAPQRSEIDAGTILSFETQTPDGWSTDRDQVEAPDIGSGFVSQIPGRTTAADSSLMVYLTETVGADDIRAVLHKDDNGFILRMDIGDVAGGFMDVFPVRVRSLTKSTDPDAPATVTVNFTITSEPAENVVIPA
jgi:hypothetical protein